VTPETEQARQHCLEAIALLHRHYQRAIQPYVDILMLIESCRPPPPLIIDAEAARLCGIDISNL
jgi:hypothetical protein